MATVEKLESYRKFVKWMSVFFIVYDLVMIALFGILAAGLFDYDTAAALVGIDGDMLGGVSLASVMSMLGWMAIASQVIHLIGVIFALHGANNPAKIKPAMIIFGIFSVCAVFGLISSFVNGAFTWTSWTQYIVTWLLFYGILQVRKLAK